eukprot:CAMPEP_0119271176 /NCGR_PEP_ID=MMETSP1329-20130426/7866_1 /TAXON_ID=114041 /ORGANISM="Genus nov. species nov., Strain RCC1024" /LENGTH=376 /DNA_ID=CAMNT_0007271219 /DNA_START=149 /DNA_END=1276 /DNA_ORIENTATION=+
MASYAKAVPAYSAPSAPVAEATVVGVDNAPPLPTVARARSAERGDAEGIRAVENMGMPRGLAEQFVRSTKDFSYRFWIIDNSGSMGTTDGKRIVNNGGREGMVSCSRWEELGASIGWHAKLAVELGAWTEFRMLNQPGGSDQNVVVGTTVGSYDPQSAQELRAIEKLVYSQPTGRTPLCAQIGAVTQQIRARAAELRASGTKACVVIASDGEATDGDLKAALRPLHDLPVWVVIRLCTDDDRIVQYWNEIDEELELDMDVLDDLCGEAAEVNGAQPWLTYASELHKLREWGTSVKVLDTLDEFPIDCSALPAFCEIILGKDACDGLPHPQLDWKGFLKALDEKQKLVPEVWDPTRKRKRPWFDLRKMSKAYGKGCV